MRVRQRTAANAQELRRFITCVWAYLVGGLLSLHRRPGARQAHAPAAFAAFHVHGCTYGAAACVGLSSRYRITSSEGQQVGAAVVTAATAGHHYGRAPRHNAASSGNSRRVRRDDQRSSAGRPESSVHGLCRQPAIRARNAHPIPKHVWGWRCIGGSAGARRQGLGRAAAPPTPLSPRAGTSAVAFDYAHELH